MAFLHEFLSSTFWFLVVVGVLVFLHEAGHFLTAKAFGIRVDAFSLGFGKRLFGWRRGGTDYRVSMIPLGGYVKLTGGEEAGEAADPIPPDYYLARPRWQRFLVLVMGATVNIVLAIALYTSAFMVGVDVPGPVVPIVRKIEVGGAAERAGLQIGDRIRRINGTEITAWDHIRDALVRSGSRALRLHVERQGEILEMVLTPTFTSEGLPQLGADLAESVVIVSVAANEPAGRAGLERNDQIEAIDGNLILSSEEATQRIREAPEREVRLTIRRDGRTIEVPVVPAAVEVEGKRIGRIGVTLQPVEFVKLGFVPAFQRALRHSWDLAGSLFHVLRNLVTRNLPFSTLSGPIEIAKTSKEFAERGSQLLVWMAFISLQLGILNLLPIPVLDGGHIFILLTEGVLRRDLSMQVKERLNQAGFVALVLLMVAVVFQDILKSVRG